MQLQHSAESRRLRALADVVSSGNAGVLPPAWSVEVVSYVDSMRYLIPRVGSLAFPATGHSLSVPNISQHTLVAARGAEKSEIPSAALTTDSETYSAAWFAGGVDVSLEVIWQSDPSVWSLVVEDLMEQYAVATDQRRHHRRGDGRHRGGRAGHLLLRGPRRRPHRRVGDDPRSHRGARRPGRRDHRHVEGDPRHGRRRRPAPVRHVRRHQRRRLRGPHRAVA